MQLLDSIVMCMQGDDRYDMDEPNPFAQEEEPGDIASVAYRYICVHVFLLFCFYFFVLHFLLHLWPQSVTFLFFKNIGTDGFI